MASLDDGIANLQKFIGEAGGSAAYLLQASGLLETAAEKIEGLDQEAQTDIGAVNRILSEAEGDLASARSGAVEALTSLGQLAEEAADDTLDTREGELEDAGDETEQAAETVRDDLDEAYSRLDDDGFRPHDTAMDDLGTGALDAKDAAEQAFEALADDVASLSSRGQALGDGAASGLAETESEVEAEVTVLAGRFDAVKDVWHDSIDGGLQASCDEVGAALQQIYTDWEGAVGGVAEALGDAAGAPMERVASYLEKDAHQGVEDAVGETLRGPAEALLTESAQVGGAAEGAAVVAESVGVLVGDLRVSVSVVGQIDKMLSELG
jgi:hypothetical protein